MAKQTKRTPLELIKDGIESADWKKVVKGYRDLTGISLKAPSGREADANITIEDIYPRLQEKLRTHVVAGVEAIINGVFERATSVSPQLDTPDEEGSGLDEQDGQEDDPGDNNTHFDEEEDESATQPSSPEEPEQPAHRVRASTDDFRIDHSQNRDSESGEAQEGKKRPCRTEPFVPGMSNKFKDDGHLEKKHAKADKQLWKNQQPTERRPPRANKKVKVKCGRCERTFEMDEADAPPILEGERCRYVCNGCVRRSRG